MPQWCACSPCRFRALRYEIPDLFIEMLLVLRAKARNHDLGLDDGVDAEEDNRVETSATDRGGVTQVQLESDSDEESAI